MNFEDYTKKAALTAIYPRKLKPDYHYNYSLPGLMYVILGLGGEVGELLGKVKKILRDNNGLMNEEIQVSLIKELGDVLWYLDRAAYEIGSSLEEVAQFNNLKLSQRKDNGTLRGSGDDR